MSGFLFVNPRSGPSRPSVGELIDAARGRGVVVHVLSPGDDPAALAAAVTASALGVAGGDGSLGPVAGVAAERGLPFVCIPFGTRNHFARDAGIDRDDPIGALEAFDGEERPIDLGRVNGRPFLNNVSLGAYAHLVHRRERSRRRGEALATVRALAIALRRRPPLRVRVDGRPLRPRILLAANNSYRLGLFSLGERERLDEGALHLYAAEGLLPRHWDERRRTRFELELEPSSVRAAVDGEPVELRSPLTLAIEPLRLRLLQPGR